MPRYTYTDRSKGNPVMTLNERTGQWHPLTIKQTHRSGIIWGSGPYHPVFKGEVIFECEASDILAADAAFKTATGLDIAKLFAVCLSIQ